MMSSGINLNKVDRLAGLSFENGLRLHFDSIHLYKNKSFPSAFFLSVLAMEEIGKSFLLMDLFWHSKMDGRMGEYWEREWLKMIYVHQTKQNSFARNFEGPFTTKKFFKNIYYGELETLKQNTVYVGLNRKGRDIELKGKIINPLKTSKKKTHDQITNVNGSLLEMTLGVIKEVYGIDSPEMEAKFNISLYNKMKKEWRSINNRTSRRLLKIQKVK